jgi:hypothetical protein
MIRLALCQTLYRLWTNLKELYKYNLTRYLNEDLDEDLIKFLPPRFTNDLSLHTTYATSY